MTAEAVTADAPTAHQHPQLVVCGTDTDVGKTVVSALVVQGLGAHYWKPVQSGSDDGTDRVWRLLNFQIWGDQFLTGRGSERWESILGVPVSPPA